MCDGLDASGKQRLRLGLRLPNNVTLADLNNATSAGRRYVDGLIVNRTARQLARDRASVNVTGYTAARRLADGRVVSTPVCLLPFDTQSHSYKRKVPL